MRRTKPAWQKDIATERIERLFELAAEARKKGTGMEDRYVEIARKIAMHYKVGIPKPLKRMYCKKCGSFMVAGDNATVRTRASKKAVVMKCRKCSNIIRTPYRKK
ncbi:MAG: ribonuclease P [Candidatus Aenigmatarchaeota archaeon]